MRALEHTSVDHSSARTLADDRVHDRTAPTSLRRRAHAAGRGRRAGGGRAFPRQHRGLRARRGGAAAGRRRRATRAASSVHGGAILARPRDGDRIVTGGDDGKVVATDAQGRQHARSRPTPSGAGSTTSRSAPTARSPGRPASRPSSRTGKGEERTLDVPSTVGGLAFAPKGFRLAIAHYNGVTLWFPNAAERARDAGVEGLASRRHLQPGRPVPGHLHAGADAARLAARRRASTCACRAMPRACARSTGPPAASGSRPRARPSSSCGRSRARTARWARRPQHAGAGRGAGRRSSPAIRRRRWSRSATPTASCCWCGSTTAPRSWRARRAGAPVTALAWSATGTALAFGTEDGEAGVIDLG